MIYLPRNLTIACNHRGLTHFGGIFFFQEFLRVLQVRRSLARHLRDFRSHHDYSLSQVLGASLYPIILGLGRLEGAAHLRLDPTFHYLTGLPSYPDPQTLRRFLFQAPLGFRQALHRLNDRLVRHFIHLPEHRSRLILDVDSTVVPLFGHQEGAEVGYNPRYRGKRSYHPLLCMEANSAFLWDVELRPGNAGTWQGSVELLASCFLSVPAGIRELRVRADAGFGYDPVLTLLEAPPVEYAVVARRTASLKEQLGRLRYQRANARWELAQLEEHRPRGWSHPRRCVVARRWRQEDEPEPIDFTLGPYVYRAWITNLPLSPTGVWHFYDGRAEIEPRIYELREDFALRKIPTHAFAANALYLELIRLAYNLVTAFQRICLPAAWQGWTLRQLRQQLFAVPAELTRPHNRPVLRLANWPLLQDSASQLLTRIYKLKPLED